MKITMIAYGTRGDVQPAVALGKALERQGSTVRILAGSNFTSWIESHGLKACSARVDMQELMDSRLGREWVEKGTNPMRQMNLMKSLIDEYGDVLIEDAWQASHSADVLISQFTSVTFSLSIAEKRSIRHLCMCMQPPLFASRDGSAVINAPLPGKKSWINHWFSKLVIQPFSWSVYGDATNRFRQKVLGLSSQSGRESFEALQKTPFLLAYSRHVAPFPDDWSKNLHQTGYLFLNQHEDWQPPEELVAFLNQGEKPVVIGFGSMIGNNPGKFAHTIVEAVKQSRQRAILLADWGGADELGLPDSILQMDGVPHDWLFPHAAAAVHHGGAGTTAASLRAGIPTVIVPHIADQPYWGIRVAAIGAGPKPIPRPQVTASRLANAIRRAVEDPNMKCNSIAIADKINSEDGVSDAIRLIAKLGT